MHRAKRTIATLLRLPATQFATIATNAWTQAWVDDAFGDHANARRHDRTAHSALLGIRFVLRVGRWFGLSHIEIMQRNGAASECAR